ncbi:shikimate dehydrogenase [Flavicella sp.]|uniref:shikimate dehydrogenase family protein n=1 Tax=Flavicella sp. TaxID=2957742 RepID=UPI002616F25D|nr:shikimate dehydrogenase [Flavicella sp.]MDG1805103.1 shikimate dehydrogenase [Flavicella sp.]MDG2280383.1 shikimate dehydrogenase [Flavicella sp.]
MSAKKLFGLVGKNIEYSFSRGYFSEKFDKLQLNDNSYVNFDLASIEEFPAVFDTHKETLQGMNVTIPYKEDVGAFLDEIDEEAAEIGAINTIKIYKNGKRKGFNTDVYGFDQSIAPFIKDTHKTALILGTGGASKAVAYAFKKRGISYKFVSRIPKDDNQISYENLSEKVILETGIIVNCSPIGTHPDVDKHPNIPFQFLNDSHLLFDLIYNPSETAFLRKGKEQGASIANGMKMLELQAEKSWEIWNRQ